MSGSGIYSTSISTPQLPIRAIRNTLRTDGSGERHRKPSDAKASGHPNPRKGAVNWLLQKDYTMRSVGATSSVVNASTGIDWRVSNSCRAAYRRRIRVVTLLRATLEVQARESSDNPRLNAFCRVAPSVRFKTLAIFRAGIFSRAADFSSRTSLADHERRLEFLAI
jgi:hypothetical protein